MDTRGPLKALEPLKRGRPVRIEGEVYCLKHGDVHVDSCDPFGFGPGDEDLCTPGDHRALYWRARKGDYA